MKKTLNKFNKLPVSKRVAFVTASVMTVSLAFSAPAFAWFYNQRKAAEMYKVEFPNALYLNAAHREDKVYFSMNAIGPYKQDSSGNLVHDNNGDLIPVDNQKYVFSVSGSNTKKYKLQLAHTNNNQFTYTIYEAEQYDTLDAAQIQTNNNDNIVEYTLHKNSHNENQIDITGDTYVDSQAGTKYYVKSTTTLSGEYKNNVALAGTPSPTETMQAKNNDAFYAENYQAAVNVQADDIPSYWQSNTINVNLDSKNKFCKYYILEVTWDNRPSNIEEKETDMIYITADKNP